MKRKKSKQSAGSYQKKPRAVPKTTASKTGAKQLLPVALLVLLCLIVYHNSLSNGFVYDDFGSIVENKYLKQPGQFLSSLFNHSYFKIAGLEASYRPVATLSYFLIYTIAELDPFYYHLASLLLHTFNAVLVYWMAGLILKNQLGALIAGLLFASHPALSEAVNCIDFNDDPLAALFFLLSLILYIGLKAETVSSNIKGYSVALFFYFLGLLSKEMAITLPAVIFLYDLVLRDHERDPISMRHLLNTLQKRAYFYSGYVAVSLVYVFIRFFILDSPGGYLNASYGSWVERIIFLPGHIFSFIKLAVFPVNLTADYVFSYPDSFFNGSNLLGVAVAMGLAGLSFLVCRTSKAVFFGIWWFLITLFPVSNLIEIYSPFAERYLYIPIIGFCLVVPTVIDAVVRRRFTRPAVATVATLIPTVIILGLYSTVTLARNPDWRNNFVLWSKTVQSSPNSLVAHGGLGMAYLERGMLNEAQQEFETAIQLYPNHDKSYYNLGVVYHQKGNLKKAMENFIRSVTLNPDLTRAHYNLATLYAQQGSMDLAIRHYVKVTELDPEVIEAHYNLGLAYAMQGKLKQAILEWEKVLQLDPHHRGAANNLAKAKEMIKSSGDLN
jgi:tetratricopeptide (TPR) repeat protein